MVDETPLSSILLETQQALFTIQAEIAGADKVIPKSVIQIMEQHIQYVDTKLPAITTFLIPGGSELSARLDMARAISRRAERVVVNLNDTGIEISADTLMYVNRLSTLLYALVRLVNYYLQVDEQKPQYFEEMQ